MDPTYLDPALLPVELVRSHTPSIVCGSQEEKKRKEKKGRGGREGGRKMN